MQNTQLLGQCAVPVFGELEQRCDLEQQWTRSGAAFNGALHTGSFCWYLAQHSPRRLPVLIISPP
jgi:hypothetical protein